MIAAAKDISVALDIQPRLTCIIASPADIFPALGITDALLDGEIVHLGDDGKPRFYSLMRR